jgi:hypothetical protein
MHDKLILCAVSKCQAIVEVEVLLNIMKECSKILENTSRCTCQRNSNGKRLLQPL